MVQAWYGGCEAGPALADVLLGAVAPSGRLPFSVPADEAGLPPFDRDATSFRYDRSHGWWHLRATGALPTFPFGFGLGYTTFAVGGVDVAAEGDALIASGSVRNTGDRDGAEVVLVTAGPVDGTRPPRLVGFARVEVAAGATVPFRVEAPVAGLATRDAEAHAWRPAVGPHGVTVGRHVGDPDAATTVVDLG